MRAAKIVAEDLAGRGAGRLEVTLYGSLALTGRGHGTDRALVAGLQGLDPETADPQAVLALPAEPETVDAVGGALHYGLRKDARGGPPGHPNAFRFRAYDRTGAVIADRVFRSIGGGFITEDGVDPPPSDRQPRWAIDTAADLISCSEQRGSVAAVALDNAAGDDDPDVAITHALSIVETMEQVIERGLRAEGELPGPLKVRRRAPALHRSLTDYPGGMLEPMEWVGLWAVAVNEENAAGGRIVTAPTNGAAGIIPAILRYARTFEDVDPVGQANMLLVAGAVGDLIKRRASISGAEVGCQGEVGSAAAMAAAALAEALGGRPAQVANAAEIALEHHLGMTCDPIGGLVQVPCIERNALGAVKAIAAAKLALRGDGRHVVSLDNAIEAMRETGLGMNDRYKETARGGLAVSVPNC